MTDRESLQTLEALARALHARHTDDPNIVGVGWGMAKRGGELRPELAVVFFVRDKFAEDELPVHDTYVIPREIEGFPTDVVIRRRVERSQDMAGSRDDDLYDPLPGGVASSNLEQMDRTFFWSEGSRGTLGILCRDSENRPMALSNWHVWAADGAQVGDRIVQPSTPTGAGYAEGVATTILCGPAVGSLLEGRLPSGLAAGLYAGAAAAALAAALSDEADPFRRGQDATPVAADTITHREVVDAEFDYHGSRPWPGRAFTTDVSWRYVRHTNVAFMPANTNEATVNPQVLRGYAVAPDRAVYEAGDTVTIAAVLWDHQPRPDDAYHVIANLVSAADPRQHLRLLLEPARCGRFPLVPPTSQEDRVLQPVRVDEQGHICLDFGFYPADHAFGRTYNFGPIAAVYVSGEEPLRMANAVDIARSGLFVPHAGVVVRHAPADRIVVHLAHRSRSPIRARAFDAFGEIVDEAEFPADMDTIHQVALRGDMITSVRIAGGGDGAELVEYCFEPVTTGSPNGVRRAGIDVGALTCVGFERLRAGEVFPSRHQFGHITIEDNANIDLQIVDWPDTEPNSLLIRSTGIEVTHESAEMVALRLGHFTGQDVTVRGLNAEGEVVAEVVKSSPNTVEVLRLHGQDIVRVTITGGGNEAILVRYCTGRPEKDQRNLMRCFRGRLRLPPDARRGRWIVYLAVQNVNHVPDGVDPARAATIIGGHVMAPTAEALGCGFMLLGDHVFDIF